jgi:hypothetical protein
MENLLSNNIHVAIRSYKRADAVSTFALAPFASIWVPESQGEAYREHYPNVITIPDAEDGNACRKNNAILKRSPAEWTLILDDDITGIGYWESGDHHWMNPDELQLMINQGFILAKDFGVRLWGINQSKDELIYATQKPFNLLAAVLGPFHGHLPSSLRYDERFSFRDDYDFWLQNMYTYHKTLRMNKYHYVHDSGTKAGGLTASRSMDAMKAEHARMRKKWGDLVKVGGSAGGKSATGKNILNLLVKSPIKGC